MSIKKNDTVLVIKGKDRGKIGKVEKMIYASKVSAIVTGLNKGKKHLKPTQKNPHGGIVDFNAPISLANLQIVCPRCNKASKVSYQKTTKSKLRICKKCHETLDL